MPNIGRESFEPITREAALASRDAGKITDGVRGVIDGLAIDGDDIEEGDTIVSKNGNALEEMIAKHGKGNE